MCLVCVVSSRFVDMYQPYQAPQLHRAPWRKWEMWSELSTELQWGWPSTNSLHQSVQVQGTNQCPTWASLLEKACCKHKGLPSYDILISYVNAKIYGCRSPKQSHLIQEICHGTSSHAPLSACICGARYSVDHASWNARSIEATMSNASLQYVHRAFMGFGLWSFSGIAQGVLKDQVMKHHEKHWSPFEAHFRICWDSN